MLKGHVLPASSPNQSPATQAKTKATHNECPSAKSLAKGLQASHVNCDFSKGFKLRLAKANALPQKPAPAKFQGPLPKYLGYVYAQGPQRLLDVTELQRSSLQRKGLIPPTQLQDFFSGRKWRKGEGRIMDKLVPRTEAETKTRGEEVASAQSNLPIDSLTSK